ncbi:MAG TPA: glutamate-1-semialdehyde 2,1-aminomutase [bacterium]|nr:glutamate-1-semialdehyde 2,1-aminomutase [bacterium]
MKRNDLFREAKRYLAGGVDSPVRAFKAVGQPPVFMKKGNGKYIYAEDRRRFTDFCLSWGALILGHNDPAVRRAVQAAAGNGTSFGAPTRNETELAKLVSACVPSIERVRFVNSGTEAVMSAVRLARGFTGRDAVVKFDGCYHGHSDGLLASAGSGVAGLKRSSSSGVPDDVVRKTISLPYNDPEALERTIRRLRGKVACVLIEPVPANMGLVLPRPGFLEKVRELTSRHGIVLIFDEVITGFRMGLGGAQGFFGVTPDLTTLGKIIGGGLPVGAFGGRKEIMDRLAPEGNVYQAGTLSGNPLTMAAGIAVIRGLIANRQAYARMEKLVADFAREWRAASPFTVNCAASMFSIFYTDRPVSNYGGACAQDKKAFRAHYRRCLGAGIYLPPATCETSFISVRHGAADLEGILRSARRR